jgi:autophagy-related protein 9
MRKENYLIALFNKDLLDLRVRLPLPKAVEHLIPPSMITGPPAAGVPHAHAAEDRKYFTFGGNSLTKALEWNLRTCIYTLFDAEGQVKMDVMRDRNRKDTVRR